MECQTISYSISFSVIFFVPIIWLSIFFCNYLLLEIKLFSLGIKKKFKTITWNIVIPYFFHNLYLVILNEKIANNFLREIFLSNWILLCILLFKLCGIWLNLNLKTFTNMWPISHSCSFDNSNLLRNYIVMTLHMHTLINYVELFFLSQIRDQINSCTVQYCIVYIYLQIMNLFETNFKYC
jgi:hypothetical protein